LTKTFIAVLVLKLLESGKIGSLDDRLSKYLADAPFASEVSIRQLLNHTSGMPDYGDLESYHKDVVEKPSNPWSREQFLGVALKQGLGSQGNFHYSNIGYLLLVDLIEKLEGKMFRNILIEQIVRPLKLGMTYEVLSVNDNWVVTGFSKLLSGGLGCAPTSGLYDPGWVAHRLIASTAPDLVHFFHSIFSGKLLNKSSLAMMCDSIAVTQSHSTFMEPAYGLGLMIDRGNRAVINKKTQVLPMFGHTGAGPGFSTACYCALTNEQRVVACVMINCEVDNLAEELVLEAIHAIVACL
jgi:D-alanyl-D-alanine carboxypeptidase